MAPVHEVGQALGVTGDLVIFTVVSDASSPSSSLRKDADAFRRRSNWSLTALWEHKEGPVVEICKSEGSLCAQKLSCL